MIDWVWYRRVYLFSDHWKEFAEMAKLRVLLRCQVCDKSTERLEVHHVGYRDRYGSILGREQFDDVIVCCRVCHLLLELEKLIGKPVVDWIRSAA